MGPKTIDYNGDKLSYKKNPGPGSYEELNMIPKTGRFTISKFRSSKYGKINKEAKASNLI